MQKRTPDDVRKLNAADVRWTCNPSQLTFGTTADLDPPDALIGQTRAERSLEFGVDIKSPGSATLQPSAEARPVQGGYRSDTRVCGERSRGAGGSHPEEARGKKEVR
mgnify:CR=1 FL=1